MKKLFALLLLMFFCSTNASLAFSELYYLKNVNVSDIQPYVEDSFVNNGFNVIKQNPYYGVSHAGNDYAVIILQQSGNNMFYYYQAENNKKINKNILKEVNKQNIVCEQSFNQNIIDIYDNIARDTITMAGAVKTYSFEEPSTAFNPPKENEQHIVQPSTLSGYVGQIPSGTKLMVYLQNAINTATAVKGDEVIAVVSNNLNYNGTTIIPQGSLVYGTLSKARNATYGSRNGRVVINFNQIVTPEGKVYGISTEEIDFTVSNDGKLANSAKSALTTAAAGAVAGLLFSLLSGNHDNIGKSMLIGAGVGAGSSVIYTTAEKGVDAEIPSFTEIELTTTQPFTVSVNY